MYRMKHLHTLNEHGTMQEIKVGDIITWQPFQTSEKPKPRKSGRVTHVGAFEMPWGFKYRVQMRGPKSIEETVYHDSNKVELKKN